jgi:hypothetical protein
MGAYFDIQQSLLKYCNEFIKKNNLDFEVFDFDSHGSINSLPDSNLLGIGEFEIENDSNRYYTTCSFVICTKADDAALVKLRPVVDKLFSQLTPGSIDIKVVTGTTGKLIGNMVVMDNVTVLPVARTETRPLQMIAVRLASSFLVPP